ncbi:MAG: hypothetical protein BGO78_03835 [Chloroflexi bacterium 44-23]|nr:MAG: hypothetical protein BGO78_03835 [Chloroflexi bacterium 44-23]
MKRFNWRFVFGGLLVFFGILALLDSVLVLPFTGILWGFLFLAGGVGFIILTLSNRSAWWAIIPGLILTSLGVLILVEAFFPRISDSLGGIIFLGGTALAFWIVYVRDRNMWWAIIPAGVFTSLSLTVLVDEFTRFDGGTFFLMGLAVTFALLTILPGLKGNRQWPLIPAGILFLVSLITLFDTINAMRYFWPILLIGVGVFLILRPYFLKKSIS